ncbi:SPT7 [Candida jiufengensis]|uniref:SPT7 n=1 Tax=Candida jiufengensis TaxID=497108 RepID=UPI0022258A7C|nr:SPT7 [Candida jiufengensis]KAI5957283.1 SPT7 [Candida jiufengensis]
MDKLNTFKLNDSRTLFNLSKKLNNQRNFFQVFLNENQYKIINFILSLDNFEIWQNFLDGNVDLRYKKVENSKEEELIEKPVLDKLDESETEEPKSKESTTLDNNGTEKESQSELKESELLLSTQNEIESNPDIIFEEGNKMIKKLALHIRYLLWEKAIDFYYEVQRLDNEMNQIDEINDDYELIDSLEVENEKEKEVEVVKPKVREVEDDYDFDDDEEEEEEPKETPTKDENILSFNDDNQLILEIPISIFKTKESQPQEEDKEESRPETIETNKDDQDKLIQEFNKVYHNFEYDRETLIKRRKLEQSDLQMENVKNNSTNEKSAQKHQSNMDIALGMSSTSLRQLLSKVHSTRDKIGLNDNELRTLFMDVRKNRGKWANDERVGQEELYEACEKVVTELRNFTEHSTFFLNKVSKREAPNYGLIIKKPMDLNTVLKKLKNLSYNSKKEFVDDLMLIWSNCLTYNADPKHFIRAHAVAMQKKSLKLVPLIPEIVIKNRSDIEKEEEENEIKKEDEDEGSGAGKKSAKKGRKRTRQDELKSEAAVDVGGKSSPSGVATPIPIEETNGHPIPNEEEEEEEEENENINNGSTSNEEEEFDPELQAWRTLTAKSRANYCEQRSNLFESTNLHLKPDAPAIIRRGNEMLKFEHYLTNKSVESKTSNLLDQDDPYLIEYDVDNGIPGFKYAGTNETQEEEAENKLVDLELQKSVGDSSNYFCLSNEKGLNKVYFNNISMMQEIRRICFKIGLVRQLQSSSYLHHTEMYQNETEAIKEIDIDAISKLPNHDINNEDVQYAVLRRNVAKIAMQTGFEKTETKTINYLTDVAIKYITSLVKSMKLETEKNNLSSTDVLLSALVTNGVSNPDQIHSFIQERLLKQSSKLKDLKESLQNFLRDLLSTSLGDLNEKNFDDNSEQYITGDFSGTIGEDYFGFKELGLDRELNNFNSLSIPIHLLHQRLQQQAQNGTRSSKDKYQDLTAYEPERLKASSIQKQIKLLLPFFNNVLEKSRQQYIKNQKKKGGSIDLPDDEEFYLVEDDDLPQKQRNIRPKLPPSGKITTIKKKIIANSFFLD